MAFDGERDDADVFTIPDFWPAPKWLQKPSCADDSASFFTTQLREISKDFSSLLKVDSIKADTDGFFKPPSPPEESSESRHDDASIISQDISIDCESEAEIAPQIDSENDVWMTLDQPAVKPPALKTWESFIDGTATQTQQPLLLTEAGPAVYDALLSWAVDPLDLHNQHASVVEAKPYFASLLALVLGRESVFFLKDSDTSFQPTLPGVRISGYSADILEGLEDQALVTGARVLELRAWIQKTYTQHALRCGVALASALNEVLRAVQQNFVAHGQNPRSILKLQSTVRNISTVIGQFYLLTSTLPHRYSDEDIVTFVFEHAYTADNSDQWLRQIMQEVLQRVSRPWAEFLEQWIGTRQEDGIPFTKSNVGEVKGFVRVEAQIHVDDFGQEVEEVDYRLDLDRMPHFIPNDIAESIFETGRNLRFIRSSHPEHPLSQPDLLTSLSPPRADWLYDWDSILQLETRVADYRDRLLDAVRKTCVEREHGKPTAQPLQSSNKHQLDLFTLDKDLVEERLLASISYLDAPTSTTETEGSLGRIVRQHLSGDRKATTSPISTPHWSLIPVLSFAGIVSAQSQVVNRESLRLLFDAHDLKSHFRLQRDFHLLGNGTFCSRLSQALFDPDLERADRQIGIARQGGVMGLRLGRRDNWPPASSELRLSLMGVLTESYHHSQSPESARRNAQQQQQAKSKPGEVASLPGDLSFAVRELSDEEIEKCMDPDSLEALDFLRLSYKAPSELAFMITPLALMQYDRIFKLLLRVLRLMYVVDQLWREVIMYRSSPEESRQTEYRLVREARHFISTIASYFLDTGIAGAWQVFEDKLDKIQDSLRMPYEQTDSSKLESPEQLRDFHSRILHAIMQSLFLRRRQEPVRKLLEDIMALVLDYAKFTRTRASGMKSPEMDLGQLYGKFEKKVRGFTTVCRALSEKGGIGGKKDGIDGLRQDGIGNDSVVAQFLTKLDLAGYYTRSY